MTDLCPAEPVWHRVRVKQRQLRLSDAQMCDWLGWHPTVVDNRSDGVMTLDTACRLLVALAKPKPAAARPIPDYPEPPPVYRAAPALMVIEQLGLEYPGDGVATPRSSGLRVLADRTGIPVQHWRNRIDRWQRTGIVRDVEADELCTAVERHPDELWGATA
jgi:hypothetical protein